MVKLEVHELRESVKLEVINCKELIAPAKLPRTNGLGEALGIVWLARKENDKFRFRTTETKTPRLTLQPFCWRLTRMLL